MPCGGARRPPTLKTLEDWAGAPGIRGQRELRTEIVACLGKNRRLRSNVEGKPWILFLFCSKFLLGDGDQILCLDPLQALVVLDYKLIIDRRTVADV